MKKENWIIIIFIIIISLLMYFTTINNNIADNVIKNIAMEDAKKNDSTVIQEELLNRAETKGFKKALIQHSLNTKWSEFDDSRYYTYVKTLKSGIKLYRAEMADMMMEIYIQNGYIKIQSSNFMLHDQTAQTLREMDAWLMSCEPTFVEGDINSSKIYSFHDFNVTLRNEGIGIHYMVACNADTPTIENKATTDIHLEKLYSNEYFSIKYPISWQIVQDDNKITKQASISVQIMEKQKNDYDFRPNINIIVSKKKWSEPTSYLAKHTIAQNSQIMDNSYHLLEQRDNISISNCQGTLINYTFNIQNYKLHGVQYIVKKRDNTTYIITTTVDTDKYSTQISMLNKIINSLIIK